MDRDPDPDTINPDPHHRMLAHIFGHVIELFAKVMIVKGQWRDPISGLHFLHILNNICVINLYLQVPGQPPRVTYTPGLKASMAAAQQTAAAAAAAAAPSPQPVSQPTVAAQQQQPVQQLSILQRKITPTSTHLTINSQVTDRLIQGYIFIPDLDFFFPLPLFCCWFFPPVFWKFFSQLKRTFNTFL